MANSPKKKEIKPVVKNAQVKNSPGKKLTGTFIEEDIKTVGYTLFEDVVVPSVKKIIYDFINNGTSLLLWSDTRGPKGSSNKSPGSRFDYSGVSSGSSRASEISSRPKRAFDYGDVTLDSKSDAEDVLEAMNTILEEYQVVTVADMFDLLGKSCDYTCNRYGWQNLKNACAERTRDGRYALVMPKALPLN